MKKYNSKDNHVKIKSKFKAKKHVSEPNDFQKDITQLKEIKKELSNVDPSEISSFQMLPLSTKTKKGLTESKYTIPTKVQCQTLIHSLRGLDVVAAAKTGSGKTLAFIIPLLESLHCNLWSYLDGLGALIITPTRELAYQIFEVLNKVGSQHMFSAGLVIGGKDLKYEWSRISTCNILICTPGRLLQHMTENPEFSCENLKLLVLDEADQCLSMGFSDTMNTILEDLPSDRQTLLFSATQTRDVNDLIRAGCRDPIFCSVHEYSKTATPKTLEESYIVYEEQDKISFLWSFLKYHKKNKILVFLSTCKQVGFVCELFTHLRPGLSVMGLHGEMHQLRRMAIYDEFCRKKNAVLFATDVAARGLDIPSVNWVLQLDCPEDVTTYIHRVGRTARHCSTGEGLLVLTPTQEESMVASLKMKNININKIDVDAKKLQDIQLKVDFAVSKYFNLKERAERALKAYLKNIVHMKNKKIFDVSQVDLDSLARSFGLSVTPRIRFVERQLKNQKKIERKSSSQISKTDEMKSKKTFTNLGITGDEIDEDFLCRSEIQPEIPLLDSKQELSEDLLCYTGKSLDGLTKQDLAKKIIKKKIVANKKVVFDEEGNPMNSEGIVHKAGSESKSESEAGLDLKKLEEKLKIQDKIDKETNNRRLREKHKKEKEKLKEENRLKVEKKNNEKTAGINDKSNDQNLSHDESIASGSDSDDCDSFTNDIIADLPDPDEIYAKTRESLSESGNESGDSESQSDSEDENEEGDASDSELQSDSEDGNEDIVEKSSKVDENIGKKSTFKGKRKAKIAARIAKRTRLAAENDMSSISFAEKEDLALFLLSGKK